MIRTETFDFLMKKYVGAMATALSGRGTLFQ
jgi:hypothetical protein